MKHVEPDYDKTVFVPYMSDHCVAIAAGMVAHGIPSAVMPPPDDESLALGLDVCRGRECLPCFTTTGDMLRLARQPDFDPKKSQILMVTSCGPCRFGQYIPMQRALLNAQGASAVEFIAPSAQNNYEGFGKKPMQLRLLIWQGIVAIDLLIKLLHCYRPYELETGVVDRVYQECLDEIRLAVEAGGGRRLVAAMQGIAEQFAGLPVDFSEQRPRIGLVGEIYLRLNSYSNQEIIRQVEAAGGEVHMATMAEWLYYINWGVRALTHLFAAYVPFFLANLTDRYQRRWERKLARPVAHLLEFPLESTTEALLAGLAPYYEPYLATEAVLTMGKAIEWAHHGFAGILNVMPFTCMPGLITAGMSPRFRPDLQEIPWLDISYQAQRGTNLNTRLEAFMYQASQFDRRRQAAPAALYSGA